MQNNTQISFLFLKESQSILKYNPVHLKGNQSWIFTGRTDAEAETPILWPPDAKNWLTGKDPDAGKDWRWEEETTEDEMVGWHHRLNGQEFEQALGVGDGQGSLACCSPWVLQSRTWLSDWTELPLLRTEKKESFWNMRQWVTWIWCESLNCQSTLWMQRITNTGPRKKLGWGSRGQTCCSLQALLCFI